MEDFEVFEKQVVEFTRTIIPRGVHVRRISEMPSVAHQLNINFWWSPDTDAVGEAHAIHPHYADDRTSLAEIRINREYCGETWRAVVIHELAHTMVNWQDYRRGLRIDRPAHGRKFQGIYEKLINKAKRRGCPRRDIEITTTNLLDYLTGAVDPR